MEYKTELQNFDLGKLRNELFAEVANHKTIDMEKPRITGLLSDMLKRMVKE